jgi:hypothetical protein
MLLVSCSSIVVFCLPCLDGVNCIRNIDKHSGDVAEATKLVAQIEEGREMLLHQVNLALFSGVVINEDSTTFDPAWNHEDS